MPPPEPPPGKVDVEVGGVTVFKSVTEVASTTKGVDVATVPITFTKSPATGVGLPVQSKV
jgi:hypothetical protein